MQQQFYFKIAVPTDALKHVHLNYTKSRVVINKIRKQLGRAIQDTGETQLYLLVGMQPDGKQRIENRCQNSKWHIDWDETTVESEKMTGQLSIIINEAELSADMIKSIIPLSATLERIECTFVDEQFTMLDYSIDGENHAYAIRNFHPSFARRWGHEKLSELLPREMLPEKRRIHGQTVGKQVKSALVEMSDSLGFITDHLKQAPIFVQTKWIRPFPKKERCEIEEQYREASISVVFSSSIKLDGIWFAGGHQHINSGMIKPAGPQEVAALRTGGVFVI